LFCCWRYLQKKNKISV